MTVATTYALNLWFDPASTSGLFEPYNSSNNPAGRGWFSRADGQDPGNPWPFAGNPDTFAPVLSAAAGDRAQFAVLPTSTPSSEITGVALTVVFSTLRTAGNNPARVASPFRSPDGNARCLLADPAVRDSAAHRMGPCTVALDANRSGSGRLRFEFSIAARVSFRDGTVREYGYDPEMDVDV
jgi:hypothetical protein